MWSRLLASATSRANPIARTRLFNPAICPLHESRHWRDHASYAGYASSVQRKRDETEEKEEEERGGGGARRGQEDRGRSHLLDLAPGVTASAAVMAVGFSAAEVLGKGLLYANGIESVSGLSPVSGIPCSILLGLAIKNQNLVPLPQALNPGIKFSTKVSETN